MQEELYVGQISMQITGVDGSVLGANQQCVPFQLDSHQFCIGASIGISLYPLHADNLESLVNYADQAMYAVKRAGKNHHALYAPAVAE